jgi:CDP-diacylglycerol--glycerol-3-phosphate 3-phosphatidyltransferase
MFDGKFRTSADAIIAPVGRSLVKVGFSADVLTLSGLLFSFGTMFAIGAGMHWQAIVLLTLTGIHDLLDGAVAKASQRSSQRGSFFDSVVDRVSDAAFMGGVAFVLISHHHGEMVLLPFAILAASFMISYQRSKAESLGLAAKGGLMERAERMILLGVALLTNTTLLPVLWVMLVLTWMTAFGRFRRVWVIAVKPVPSTTPSLRTRTQARRQRRALSRASQL